MYVFYAMITKNIFWMLPNLDLYTLQYILYIYMYLVKSIVQYRKKKT